MLILVSEQPPVFKMSFFTGPAVLLLMTCSLVSAEDADYLVVLYQQKTITPIVGSSAKLLCEAEYELKKCGLVHVVWRKTTEPHAELTDPTKYFTTVSETGTETRRLRKVVTEMVNVSTRDSGQYQCNAECASGEKAMGHFITVRVKGSA